MTHVLLSLDRVNEKVTQGKKMLLAAEEDILKQVAKGSWIGGTIPYFMASEGGLQTRDKIFVTELPDYISKIDIKVYEVNNIPKVFLEAPENGFSEIIIPASSPILLSFALNAPNYEGFGTRPLIGWISGMHLDDLGKKSAKVINGLTGSIHENSAVVMHVTLPKDKYADIGIVNIFSQGLGDTITFFEDGFNAKDVMINGEKRNFAEYIKGKNLDTRFPLVANYYGAMINISFQSVDEANKQVNFYAPVFKGIEYKQAADVGDYVKRFTAEMPEVEDKIAFACNCILNYLYSELEGKQTGVPGPMTFGEVAYQLLNQTLAYITIEEHSGEDEEEL